jgi:N-acyl-L-homoserine lactone synthetase
MSDGRVVGCVRVVEESGAGLPAQDYYDFAPRLPRSGVARVGSMGMMAIHPCYRRGGIFFVLVGMGHYWAARRGLTHLIGAVAPGAEPLVRSLGYEALAPQAFHEGLRRWAIPMLLDMNRMSARLAAFVAEQHRGRSPEDFDRTFLRDGEVITLIQ